LTLNRDAVAPSSPGLAASATLGQWIKNHSTAKRLRHSATNQRRPQPPCGWESTKPRTQGSRSGNPGLQDSTALRFAQKRKARLIWKWLACIKSWPASIKEP